MGNLIITNRSPYIAVLRLVREGELVPFSGQVDVITLNPGQSIALTAPRIVLQEYFEDSPSEITNDIAFYKDGVPLIGTRILGIGNYDIIATRLPPTYPNRLNILEIPEESKIIISRVIAELVTLGITQFISI